jgi:hypothetical protein
MRCTLPALAVLSLSAPASAAFVGWAAYSRVDAATSTVFVDVFANFDGASDRVLNVFNANVAASGAGFLQSGLTSRKAWAPQAGQTVDDRDSFMTIGGTFAGEEFYASAATGGDPGFTATAGAWNPTILSTPSTAVPANAGWFAGNPNSVDIVAIDLDAATGGLWQNRAARYGVWVAHFAFDATTVSAGDTVSFSSQVGYKANGNPGGALYGTDARVFSIPAPGAIALLAAAGLVGSRVRVRPGHA